LETAAVEGRAGRLLGLLVPRRASLFVKVIVPVLLLFTLFTFGLGFWIAGITRSSFLRQSSDQTGAQLKMLGHILDRDWANFAQGIASPVLHRHVGPMIEKGVVDHTSAVLEKLAPELGADFIHAYDAKGTYFTSSRTTRTYQEPAMLAELSRSLIKTAGSHFLVQLPADVLEFEKLDDVQPRGSAGQVLAVGTHAVITDEFGDPLGMLMAFRILNGAQQYIAELTNVAGAGVSVCHDGHAVATALTDARGQNALGADLCDSILAGMQGSDASPVVRGTIAGVNYTIGLLPLVDRAGAEVGAMAVANPIDVALREASAIRWRIILIGLVALAAFSFLIALIIRRVFGSVNQVVEHMKSVAGGNLAQTLHLTSNDEMQLLADAIDETVATLRGLIGRVEGSFNQVESVSREMTQLADALSAGGTEQQTVSARLEEATSSLDGMVNTAAAGMGSMRQAAERNLSSLVELASSVGETARNADAFNSAATDASSATREMSASITQVADSVGSLTRSIAETSAAMGKIDRAVNQIREVTGRTRDLSRELSREASQHGREAMEKANAGMASIKELVGTLGETVKTVGRRTTEISEIVVLIMDIADQTNLLALNASILAAQAGENGRGFAVVAGEIRNLAEKTNSSIKQIEGHVRSIQDESRRAVDEAVRGITVVDEGVRQVAGVEQVLDRIIAGVTETGDMTERIANQTDSQSAESATVTRSLDQVSSMAQQLTQAAKQQEQAARYIAGVAEGIGEKAGLMKHAADEQHGAVKYLNGEIQETAVQADAVAAGAGRAASGVAAVRESTAVIRRSVLESQERVQALRDAVQLLKERTGEVRTHISSFRLT
jgi:methyl-accepting chemotaxis protein